MSPSIETFREVEDRIRNQLRDNAYRALRQVAWQYHDGVLTLRGQLPSYYLKQMAQAAVAGTAGVEQVVNEIEVVAAAHEVARA